MMKIMTKAHSMPLLTEKCINKKGNQRTTTLGIRFIYLLAYQPEQKVNLSCPNIGNEGLVCYDRETTKKACHAIRNTIGNTPLIVKTGYFADDKELSQFAEIINEYADGVAAINTIPAPVVDKERNQALPGPHRMKSGICGASIKWAGLDMVKRLTKIKQKKGYSFAITGVGGVMNTEDYKEYKKAGADDVMSATGSMWNPFLAQEIKEQIMI